CIARDAVDQHQEAEAGHEAAEEERQPAHPGIEAEDVIQHVKHPFGGSVAR
ncbi:hypothetical protein GZ031_27670, partial [Klebsiella pneumoniae]|nr:hypothetical protein [Klebsiella pneumoniae]